MPIGVMRFPTPYPIDSAVVACTSEALGFDALWLGEHGVLAVNEQKMNWALPRFW